MRSSNPLRHALTRSSLGYLALVGYFVGIWALFFPAGFYLAFPGCGLTWVSIEGPFNEHLIRDVGALFLSTGVLATFGLFKGHLVRPLVVGAATLAYDLPHLVYHVSKFGTYTVVDQVGNAIVLGLSLAASLWLLIATEPRVAREPDALSAR